MTHDVVVGLLGQSAESMDAGAADEQAGGASTSLAIFPENVVSVNPRWSTSDTSPIPMR